GAARAHRGVTLGLERSRGRPHRGQGASQDPPGAARGAARRTPAEPVLRAVPRDRLGLALPLPLARGARRGPKMSSWGRSLSLKARLGLVFSGLMLLAVLFSSLTLYQQHRVAVRGAQTAVRESAQLE